MSEPRTDRVPTPSFQIRTGFPLSALHTPPPSQYGVFPSTRKLLRFVSCCVRHLVARAVETESSSLMVPTISFGRLARIIPCDVLLSGRGGLSAQRHCQTACQASIGAHSRNGGNSSVKTFRVHKQCDRSRNHVLQRPVRC